MDRRRFLRLTGSAAVGMALTRTGDADAMKVGPSGVRYYSGSVSGGPYDGFDIGFAGKGKKMLGSMWGQMEGASEWTYLAAAGSRKVGQMTQMELTDLRLGSHVAHLRYQISGSSKFGQYRLDDDGPGGSFSLGLQPLNLDATLDFSGKYDFRVLDYNLDREMLGGSLILSPKGTYKVSRISILDRSLEEECPEMPRSRRGYWGITSEEEFFMTLLFGRGCAFTDPEYIGGNLPVIATSSFGMDKGQVSAVHPAAPIGAYTFDPF